MLVSVPQETWADFTLERIAQKVVMLNRHAIDTGVQLELLDQLMSEGYREKETARVERE